jgi:hypothetical protein
MAMKKRGGIGFGLAVGLAVGVWPSMAVAQFPSLPGGIPGVSKGSGGGASAGLGSGLSDGQIGDGLKQALSVGTEKAVKLVSAPGGYLDNAAIKILLPKNLQPLEKGLRAAGQGPKVDEFIGSMNHAAETAAPEAAGIFAAAVKSMTIDDARKLLGGGDTSITDYFKEKTSADLTTAFKPHVEQAMSASGVTEKYDALKSAAPKMPFGMGGGSGGFDLNAYVVQKALDGLFYMLGQQEKEIRTNPAARSTALLKQVFGK